MRARVGVRWESVQDYVANIELVPESPKDAKDLEKLKIAFASRADPPSVSGTIPDGDIVKIMLESEPY